MKQYGKILFAVVLTVGVATSIQAVQQKREISTSRVKPKPVIVVKSLVIKAIPGGAPGQVFNEGDRAKLVVVFQNKGKAKSLRNQKFSILCSAGIGRSGCPVKNESKSIGKEIPPNETHRIRLPVILEKAGEYRVTVKIAGRGELSQKTVKFKVVPPPKRKLRDTPVTSVGQTPSNKLTPKPSIKMKFQIHLSAKMFGGDFTKWVTEYKENAAGIVHFRWKTLFGEKVKPFPGRWQISRVQNFSKVIGQGNAGTAPGPGKGYRFFSINFKQLIQSYSVPVTFYVRVLPVQQLEKAVASFPVSVTILKADEITFFSTKGLYPELWNPVPIRISLENFKIIQEDEEGDEEPYIIMVIIYADGTTVDLLSLGTSSVRIHSTKQTHGNVRSTGIPGVWGLKVWEGPWNTTILPIGLNALEVAEAFHKQQAPPKELFLKNTFIAVLVAAMEEDASATADINTLKNTFVNSIQTELNEAIQSLGVTIASSPSEIQDQVKEQLEMVIKKVETAMKIKLMEIVKQKLMAFPLSLGQLIDPDNFVGADYKIITLKQLMDHGTIVIPMDFNSCSDCDAHYRLEVYVKKRN